MLSNLGALSKGFIKTFFLDVSGVTFTRIEDGSTFKAVIRILSAAALEEVVLEGGASAAESNPILLDDIDPNTTLNTGDRVYQSVGSSTADRLVILSVQDKQIGATVVKRMAVAVSDPKIG